MIEIEIGLDNYDYLKSCTAVGPTCNQLVLCACVYEKHLS